MSACCVGLDWTGLGWVDGGLLSSPVPRAEGWKGGREGGIMLQGCLWVCCFALFWALHGEGRSPVENVQLLRPSSREGGTDRVSGGVQGLPHGAQGVGGGVGWRVGSIGLSLLGLLAKIKCSICSYQLNI